MSWGAAIPAGIGLISSLFGKGKGKKTEYAAQAPEYQQQFSEDFMKFLQGQIGQGATPYGGQVAASAQNPFTQSALGLWGASPYGQFSGGQPQMPQQMPQMPMGQLGGGQAPGGQRPMPQRPMMGIPFPIDFGGILQHNQKLASSPDLPQEAIDKIREMAKDLDFSQDHLEMPTAEPHCNCPYCQIARITNGYQSNPLKRK